MAMDQSSYIHHCHHTHTRTHAHSDAHMQMHTQMHTHTHTHTHTSTHTHTHVRTHTHTCMRYTWYTYNSHAHTAAVGAGNAAGKDPAGKSLYNHGWKRFCWVHVELGMGLVLSVN